MKGQTPKLVINKTNGCILLLLEGKGGVVIHMGDSYYEIGFLFSNWNLGLFEDYDGKVTLSN